MNIKKLIKITTHNIDGFKGCDLKSISYMIADEKPTDDDELDQNDVQEADVVFDSYNTYEILDEITEEEITILKKFKILK